jgi:hypothetical protein
LALQSVIDVNVDFYKKEHILINAKQYDDGSRFISVTCYNNGEILPINSGEHSAYVRYKKTDNHSVFNVCEINRKGNIIIELTEQMLASEGICKADLVVTKKGSAKVDGNTGEITVDNAAILSTMVFYIDVSGTAVENSEIESTYEFNVLNETLKKYEADYKDVITASKSWAVGGTGTRSGEDENNAKYYAELALKNAYGGDSIVTGIKCTNDKDYRNGKVTISAENVGAIPVTNIATASQIKSYLGI